MKIILTFFIILLGFNGCNMKVSNILQKDEQYITLMQYTRRGEIVNSFETIALINVTYLNHILKDKNITNEKFIIGVYNSNDYKGYKKGGIFNPDYNLTMNNQTFISAKKADIIKLKNYPFYNKWMKYYEVEFPKSNSNNLVITYKNKKGSVTLNITKNLYK